jgi:DNA repair photolyase
MTEVSTAFSIGTLDEDAWRASEPGTPHPRKRIEAVRTLNEAGIPCGVLMAPILPGITDDPRQLREVVAAAIDAGATHVSPILLHLRPGVREEFSRGSRDLPRPGRTLRAPLPQALRARGRTRRARPPGVGSDPLAGRRPARGASTRTVLARVAGHRNEPQGEQLTLV